MSNLRLVRIDSAVNQSPMTIRTYRMIGHSKEFVGILKAYDADGVTITDEDGEDTTFQKKDIALIRQAFDF